MVYIFCLPHLLKALKILNAPCCTAVMVERGWVLTKLQVEFFKAAKFQNSNQNKVVM